MARANLGKKNAARVVGEKSRPAQKIHCKHQLWRLSISITHCLCAVASLTCLPNVAKSSIEFKHRQKNKNGKLRHKDKTICVKLCFDQVHDLSVYRFDFMSASRCYFDSLVENVCRIGGSSIAISSTKHRLRLLKWF